MLGIHLLHCKKGKRGFALHILEKCEQDQLGEKEANWLKKLHTFHPLELNIRHIHLAQEVSASGQVFSKRVKLEPCFLERRRGDKMVNREALKSLENGERNQRKQSEQQ